MAADHLALGLLDPGSLLHPFPKRFGLLFPTPCLEKPMVLAHHQRAVALLLTHALTPLGTVRTEPTPLESVTHFAAGLLSAAVGWAGRTVTFSSINS